VRGNPYLLLKWALPHIRGAVAHHMYEEEGNWFIDLKKKAAAVDQSHLTTRYKEEFDRYMGTEAMGAKHTEG
jgi:hypothetical protein